MKNKKESEDMKKMEQATYIKAALTTVFAFLSSLLGVLALPVVLMAICNIVDYLTGIAASKFRNQKIESYKGMKGITKKICMWLLVIVGAVIDKLIIYAGDVIGYTLPFTFFIACLVAIWIICNELISILENVKDMGVNIPPFLQPLVNNIKSQVESKANVKGKTDSEDAE